MHDKERDPKLCKSIIYSVLLIFVLAIIIINNVRHIVIDIVFTNVYFIFLIWTFNDNIKSIFENCFKLFITCSGLIILNLICIIYHNKIFPMIYIFYPGILCFILLFATFKIIKVSPLVMIISFIMIIFFGVFKIELWQIVSLIIICVNEFLSYDNIKFNCLKNSNKEIENLEKNKIDDLKAKHKLSNYKIFLNLNILNMYFSFLISGILEKYEYDKAFANLLFDNEGFISQIFARGTLTILIFLLSTFLFIGLYIVFSRFVKNGEQKFVDYAKEKIFGIKKVENK